MSLLIAITGGLLLILLVSMCLRSLDERRLRRLASIGLLLYLFVVFVVALGIRQTGDNVGVNLRLFNNFTNMFSGTAQRLREWGFPQGLKELKWVGYSSWKELVLNLLMLLPVGLLVPLAFHKTVKWWMIMLFGIGISLTIETFQLVFRKGWFDVDDLFLNVLGSLLGWWVCRIVVRSNLQVKNVQGKINANSEFVDNCKAIEKTPKG